MVLPPVLSLNRLQHEKNQIETVSWNIRENARTGLMCLKYPSFFICLCISILHRKNLIAEVAIWSALTLDCCAQRRSVCIFLDVGIQNGPEVYAYGCIKN